MQFTTRCDLKKANEWWGVWHGEGWGDRYWHKADVVDTKRERLLREGIAEGAEGLGDEVYMWHRLGVEHWNC